MIAASFSQLRAEAAEGLPSNMRRLRWVIGALLLILIRPILPYALAFAGGVMLGFALMMMLDVALG